MMGRSSISIIIDLEGLDHFSKSEAIVRGIASNFRPLLLATWAHGAGYQTFRTKSKVANFLLAAYPFLCDLFVVYFVLTMTKALFFTGDRLFKIVCFIVCGTTAGELLRFFIFKNWRSYHSVIGIVCQAYHSIAPYKELYFRRKVLLFAVANATWSLTLGCMHSISTLLKAGFRDCLGDNVLWGVQGAWKVGGIVFMHFGFYWALLSIPFLFFGYFYFVCHVLHEALREFQAKLLVGAWGGSRQVLLAHNRLSSTILRVSKTLETPLMLTTTITLFSAFFDFFSMLFTTASSPYDVPCWIVKISYNVLVFSGVCFKCSKINCAVREIKASTYSFLVNPTLEDLALVLKVQDETVAFTLYDSFVINKGMLLTALGTLMTYGIMIATWGESSSD